MYTEPGIEATACARELLYVYVYVYVIMRIPVTLNTTHSVPGAYQTVGIGAAAAGSSRVLCDS